MNTIHMPLPKIRYRNFHLFPFLNLEKLMIISDKKRSQVVFANTNLCQFAQKIHEIKEKQYFYCFAIPLTVSGW